MPRLFAGMAVLLALLAAAFLLFADTYSGTGCSADSSSAQSCVDTSATLIEENGTWVLLLLAVPVCLAAAELLLIQARSPRAAEILLAVIFLGACFLAIFSVGAFFLPAAVLSAAAVALDHPEKPSQPT